MLKLRTLLLSNYLYIIVIFLVALISFFRLNTNNKSVYNEKQNQVTGVIDNIAIDGNKLKLKVKAKENIIGYYFFTTKKEKEIITNKLSLGHKVQINGSLKKIKSPKNTLFNYQNYLKYQGIFYQINIEEISLTHHNISIYYKIKDFCLKRIHSPYLYTFILGDNSYLKDDVVESFRNIGISHLFAISGMHISLLSLIFLSVLKKLKLKEEKRYLITSLILITYLLLINTPSILRATIFFCLFSLNKIYYFYIKPTNIFLLTLSISLLINPFYIYDVGFLYSFSISFALIVLGNFINHHQNKLLKLFLISLVSFIVSIPITITNFYSLNFLSIIYNLFFVPLISYVIFPFSLLTFLFPFLTGILNVFTDCLEALTLFLNKITILSIPFLKVNNIIYILYYLLIILFFYGVIKSKFKLLIPLTLLLLVHILYPIFSSDDYLYMLDVGQGDSILLHSNNKTMLIDTGGIMSYTSKSWQKQINKYSIVKNITIPTLKSLGIRKINYLILTHGDYDHLGETQNLLANFKVEKIYLNNGYINHLENKIVKSFKKTTKLKENTSLQLGDFAIEEINKDLGEENDSSSILYVTIKNKKILFMGDASIKSEEYIINNYNLGKIDILKLGHHGSKTSSSEEFLDEIKPTLGLISVGLDNKFKHPSKEVIRRLKKRKIKYLKTCKEGFIRINFS